MARFPCSRCGQIYRGPQQTAYPAVVTKSVTYQEKLRLCPSCFAAVTTNKAWSLADPEDMGTQLPCGLCGSAETPVAIFCTYYAAGEDRADLYGRLCAERCPTDFLEAVWGTIERGQAALRVG